MSLPLTDEQQDQLAALLRRSPRAGYLALVLGDALDASLAPVSDGKVLRDMVDTLLERWADNRKAMTPAIEGHMRIWRQYGALSSTAYDALLEKIRS